jgi:hypothetical protein
MVNGLFLLKVVHMFLKSWYYFSSVERFRRGSDGEEDSASDFHFNDSGFTFRFGHRNFSSTFHHFYNFSTIRTLDRWKHFPLSSVKNNWFAQFQNFHHAMPVCECECVNECDFRLKVVCCWGTLAWYGGSGNSGTPTLARTIPVSS